MSSLTKEQRIEQRRAAREQAFVLIFEKSFTEKEADDIIAEAIEARELEPVPFAISSFKGVFENIEVLDSIIEELAKGWQLKRLPRTALAVLRLALYEMIYLHNEIPYSVSINEAVELAKKFGGKDDSSFINGILSAQLKRLGEE
ncbi:MAG: transcription antitermination factor NusB [Oscillospiraceae bacterium]|jgi:N utilization substance protein B|nr:transcription antitermination factor NusB [Oscillospiraceae bacterium]